MTDRHINRLSHREHTDSRRATNVGTETDPTAATSTTTGDTALPTGLNPDYSPRKTRKFTEGKKCKKLRESISSYSTDEVQDADIFQLFHFRVIPWFPWFLMNYPVQTGAFERSSNDP